MDFFKRAAELQEETVENRRYLHQNAEVGLSCQEQRSTSWRN